MTKSLVCSQFAWSTKKQAVKNQLSHWLKSVFNTLLFVNFLFDLNSKIFLNYHGKFKMFLREYTVRKVFAKFTVFDWWRYCKALCDVKFSLIEGSGWNFFHIELSNSVISLHNFLTCVHSRTCLHDGEEVGEVLVHGGGNADQLIAAGLHHLAAGQVTWRRAPAHQALLTHLNTSVNH